MRKKISKNEFFHLINHGPCVLVTSGDEKKYNVSTIAWIMPLNDDPPMMALAISKNSYTSELILKTKEFVVNVMSGDFVNTLKICGSVSGRRIDKFKKANLNAEKSSFIKTPFVKESIAHIECKLREYKEYNGVVLFIGDVVNAEVNSEYYDGYLITDKARTPHHLGGNFFIFSNRRVKI